MTSPADLPSRELDAAVAREVMGWPATSADHEHGLMPTPGGLHRSQHANRKVPRYSTDMRAMGTVLDALKAREWKPDMKWIDGEWIAIFWPGSEGESPGSASSPLLPRAVALAALAAVGGK